MARASKVPSVLLLVITGIALRQWSDLTATLIVVPKVAPGLLGIVGLITAPQERCPISAC